MQKTPTIGLRILSRFQLLRDIWDSIRDAREEREIESWGGGCYDSAYEDSKVVCVKEMLGEDENTLNGHL